ncbi:MAG: nucleotidyltransferase domain-containing protein [Muricoprocola sp.]
MPINEIEELKDSFVKDLMPLRIYLFGSFAEGTQKQDSDLDFYIVVNDYEKDLLDLTAKAYKSIRHKQKRAVDIIVDTEKNFERRKVIAMSVESEVERKGVLLYGERGNTVA